MHTRIASEIVEREGRERDFFKGYRESRAFHCAAMCVGAYMSMCMHSSPASVSGCACLALRKQPSDVTQTDPCLLSQGSQASLGTYL